LLVNEGSQIREEKNENKKFYAWEIAVQSRKNLWLCQNLNFLIAHSECKHCNYFPWSAFRKIGFIFPSAHYRFLCFLIPFLVKKQPIAFLFGGIQNKKRSPESFQYTHKKPNWQ
jgi:hypothetical protein